MPADFKYYDTFGIERTITNVLQPLELTQVTVDGTTNIITVAEASVVYPGQAIFCPGVPLGSFVHSVKKSTGNPTKLELWRSVFDYTTGVWSTSGTNANSTAASTNTTAMVYGFSPVTIIERAYAMGMWRNSHRLGGTGQTQGLLTTSAGAVTVQNLAPGSGAYVLPTTSTIITGGVQPTAVSIRNTDELEAVPKKRHNGEIYGVYLIVSQFGYHNVVQAIPEREILYSPAA